MNIHFDDTDLLKTLMDQTIVSFKVGSHLYGLDDNKSDEDYIFIYRPSVYEKNNFFFLHHQLQYNDNVNNRDYIFTSINSFIHNMINGDSTINFELLQSGLFEGTPLSFLNGYKEDFKNFSITRSFLGMARRDIEKFNKRIDTRDRMKGYLHIHRAYHSVERILNGEYDFNEICSLLKSQKECILEYSDIELNKMVKAYSSPIQKLRYHNTDTMNNKKINKYMKVDRLRNLSSDLIDFNLSNLSTMDIESMDKIIELYTKGFEEGVTY